MSGITMKMKIGFVGPGWDANGNKTLEQVNAYAVYGPENEPWSSATPNASFSAYINNPAAHGMFKIGDEVMVTVTPCPKVEPKAEGE